MERSRAAMEEDENPEQWLVMVEALIEMREPAKMEQHQQGLLHLP